MASAAMRYLLLLVAIVGLTHALVPKPAQISTGTGSTSACFQLSTSSTSSVLQNALQRYQSIIYPFGVPISGCGSLQTVNVVVASNDEPKLLPGVDESYTMSISSSSGTIKANTVWGALHGLASLSQLVSYDLTSGTYNIVGTPIEITDAPRFGWRGLLIDTARHYLSIASIKRTIDALSYVKMNTLHWHAVDAQSFPIVSQRFPFLTKGAYAPNAIYTAADITGIIEYGRQRGVRVIAEFDVPGHAAAWGVGDPSLVVTCPKYSRNINNIPLDVTKQHTYDVLNGFLNEMVTLFTDQYIHLGGDEVVYGCWLDNQGVLDYMKQHGIQSATQLYQMFENKVEQLVASINKTLVLWNDVFDNGVRLNPATTVYQVWNNHASLQNIITAGFKAITSTGWYLDKQIPDDTSTTHYKYWDTWIDFYNNDPYNNLSGNHTARKLILGGEATMWGEDVDSQTLDPQVWPRAAAIAERLWSPQDVTDVKDATVRMVALSCVLKQRGINSVPLAPGFCPLPSDFAN